MNCFLKFVCGLLLICISSESQASGRPKFDIDSIAAKSDTVAIVQLRAADKVLPSGDLPRPPEYAMHAQVFRTLKGSVPKTFLLSYVVETRNQAFATPREGTRMVFVSSTNGRFSPADNYYPDLPAVVDGCPDLKGDLSAKIRCEIANVISTTGAEPQKEELLSRDYALPRGDYLITALMDGLKRNTDPTIVSRLQATLLLLDQVSVLPTVTKGLLENRFSPREKQRFEYVIGNNIKDPAALASLRQLSRSSDEELRSAAARGLWHVSSEHAIPDLARLLNDSNAEIRYCAVRGLGDITGQDAWNPSIPEFEAHSEKYLSHWREWAAANVKSNDTDSEP